MSKFIVKYRGKDIKTDEWLYGYYIKDSGNNIRIVIPDIENDGGCICPYPKPETVGQFVNLTDVDDAELYVGDILEETCPRKRKYVIKANMGGFVLEQVIDGFFRDALSDSQTVDFVTHACKKVGNIYENPELLEIKNV